MDLDDEAFDLLSDDSDDDISFLSEADDEPMSINVDFSNGSPLQINDFIIVHYNINSITAEGRLESLSQACEALKIDVLVLTESKLCDTIPTNLIMISGFHEPLRRDRNRHGGGVLIYISDNLTFKQKNELQSDKFDHIWADVRVNEKLYSVNAFYRPPCETNESHSEFLEETDRILARLGQHKADNKIIASDLNFGNVYCKFPVLPPKPLDNMAPELFSSHSFSQLIDIPTRVTETTTSVILFLPT